jgi:glutamyl-tRNA reductase
VVGVAADPDVAGRAALAVLADQAELSPAELVNHAYRLAGIDAVRHMFLVAASLRSTVVGEPHILGQIKAGLGAARQAGMSGPGLEAVVQAALACGKRVRSETRIGERPVSAAAAAVERARSVHGNLATRTVLVIGIGEMGEIITQALREAGLVRIGVTHPRDARAEQAARLLDARLVPFAGLAAALAEADILVATLGARQPVVSHAMMRKALKARRNRPVLIVDVAVPGDIDPAVDQLEAAFLYTFDDLERVAEDGRQSRETAAAEAARLVEDAVAGYIRDRDERSAVPALTLLREQFEAARRTALTEAGDDADKATRLLVGRLLHGPTRALRRLAAETDDADRARLEVLLRRLFDPDGGD